MNGPRRLVFHGQSQEQEALLTGDRTGRERNQQGQSEDAREGGTRVEEGGTGTGDSSPKRTAGGRRAIGHLYEIETGIAVSVHDEDRKVRVGFLDAMVEHPEENGGVLGELHHELLALLKVFEAGRAHLVNVVEEEVALAAQLHLLRATREERCGAGWQAGRARSRPCEMRRRLRAQRR